MWPPFFKETLKQDTIIDKNKFKLILFACGIVISPNIFIIYLYTLTVNTSSKMKKRTHQIH